MNITIDMYKIKLLKADAYYYSCTLAKAKELYKETLKPFLEFDFIPILVFKEQDCWQEDPEATTYFNQNVVEPELFLDKEKILALTLANIKFEVLQKTEIKQNVTQELIKLAEKPVQLVNSEGGNTYNNKCEVHMPGQALSLYNEMLLLEDACTDALQESLNTGWRIVAACPQPDQRRPDYILGRYNPNKPSEDGALRAVS